MAMTNRRLTNVRGGRSRKPTLMNAHVEPQMPQSRSQTTTGCTLWRVATFARGALLWKVVMLNSFMSELSSD